MQSPKLKNLAFALCLAFLPSTVLAAGLGKLNVMSGLGEPLKADIELLSVTAEELSTISAAIASTEAYANQGIEKPASHSDIKIQVTKNARGVPVLKLNSVQPITDAFLDMLIQVDWSSGRLLREYTLLLDPPGYNSESQPTTQLPSSSATPQSTTSGASATSEAVVAGSAKAGSSGVSKAKKSSAPKPEAVQAAPAPTQDVSNTEYTTERGDTLAKIAQEMKPEGVSLEQMLVGLYQANPKAFDGNNMNRLKVGQIVRAPSADELESTSKQAAAKEVRVHSANWNAYKNKLAGIVAESTGTEDAAPTQSSSGKVMAAEDKAAPAASGPRDVVKLSATDNAAKNGAGDKALHDKVIALQEEATAKDNALKEVQGRAADLEKQIEDMKKLMALKNDAMAKIQSDAANQPKSDPTVPAPVEVAPAAAETPVPLTNPTTETPPVAQPEAAAPAETKAPAPAPTTPAPVAESPNVVSGILQSVDTTMLGLAGGGLALLGAGWLYLRNKRKKNLTSFEEGIMTSGGLKANTVFGNTAGGTVDTGDTSFLTDFSQSTSGGMIDAHDVDPIAEAEVYMAYGRDAQAEEILKDAIVKEPKRHELHLKLLEIYQASGNTSAFETISGELYTTLGASDPVWAKVAQLGIKMDPDNPLYKVEAVEHDSAEPAAGTAKDDFFASYDSDATAEEAADATSSEDDVLNLDQGNTTISNVAEPSPFDLDLGALDFDMDTPAEPSLADAPAEPAVSYDLDAFNLEDSTVEAAPSLSVTAEPEAETLSALPDFGEISLNDAPDITAEIQEAPKSLDVPTIDFPNFSMQSSHEDSIALTTASSTGEAPAEESAPAQSDVQATSLEDFSIEFGAASDDEQLDSLQAEEAQPDDLGMAQAPSFDLTDINLDLNDLSTSSAVSSMTSSGEPEEVETKLDLVMAYLDMEDKIGAKELLEEVMKEGGENQRKRATELLEKIG